MPAISLPPSHLPVNARSQASHTSRTSRSALLPNREIGVRGNGIVTIIPIPVGRFGRGPAIRSLLPLERKHRESKISRLQGTGASSVDIRSLQGLAYGPNAVGFVAESGRHSLASSTSQTTPDAEPHGSAGGEKGGRKRTVAVEIRNDAPPADRQDNPVGALRGRARVLRIESLISGLQNAVGLDKLSQNLNSEDLEGKGGKGERGRWGGLEYLRRMRDGEVYEGSPPLFAFAHFAEKFIKRHLRAAKVTGGVEAIEDEILSYCGMYLSAYARIFYHLHQLRLNTKTVQIAMSAMQLRYRVTLMRNKVAVLHQMFDVATGFNISVGHSRSQHFMSLAQRSCYEGCQYPMVLLETGKRLAVRDKYDIQWGMCRPYIKYLSRSLFRRSPCNMKNSFVSRYNMSVHLVHTASNSELLLINTADKLNQNQVTCGRLTPWVHNGVADYNFTLTGGSLGSSDGNRHLKVMVGLKVCQPVSMNNYRTPYSAEFDFYVSQLALCYTDTSENTTVGISASDLLRGRSKAGFISLTAEILGRHMGSGDWKNLKMMYEMTWAAIDDANTPSSLHNKPRWYRKRLFDIMMQGNIKETPTKRNKRSRMSKRTVSDGSNMHAPLAIPRRGFRFS
eukprot:CAMPEP_0184506270 /NCGR_PEP_ID=MMETSP0113_2-20130426/53413_1 /TAXON_ID=91329 /ORGANISM="Norrisiella sphaerica, Strain BC52" /LENGTH=619 /DNA_ID=CAMNT_0026895983 /DNA_START=637 /DNA_END=2493 /DNA_ORIENTATION=+